MSRKPPYGKVWGLSPQPGAQRIKGVLRSHFDTKRNVWIVRSWPKGNGGDTPKRKAAREQFMAVQQMIKNATSDEVAAAQEITAGTPLLVRDVLMKAAYGTLIEATGKDGSQWMGIRDVQPSAQMLLNSISNVVGSMLYKGPDGWVGVNIGSPGQVLTVDGDTVLPAWKDPTGGGGGVSGFTPSLETLTVSDAQNFAARGTQLKPSQSIKINAASVLLTQVAGGVYQVGIASFDTVTKKLTSAPAYSEAFTSAASGLEPFIVKFTTPFVTTKGTQYLFFVVRTDATGTTSLNMTYSTSPISSPAIYQPAAAAAWKLASNAPDTTGVWASGTAIYNVLPIYELP